MSHFVVIVVGDDVEDQLAPFQENNMGDCPKHFLTFHDQTEEVTKQFNERTDEEKEKYPDIDTFAKSWFGYKKGTDPSNPEAYGYWENPNAKWDWYQIGGRWAGYFMVKAGAKSSKGSPSLLMRDFIYEDGHADQLMKGDIDFDSMVNKAADRAASEYDQFLEAVKGTPEHTPWEAFVKRVKDKEAELDPIDSDEKRQAVHEFLNLMREEYHNQPRILALRKAESDVRWSDPDEFLIPRDQYVSNAMRRCIVPYAIVKDKTWYGKGDMGWWGMSSNEISQDEWNTKVYDLLMNLPDDTLLTAVDCHI